MTPSQTAPNSNREQAMIRREIVKREVCKRVWEERKMWEIE